MSYAAQGGVSFVKRWKPRPAACRYVLSRPPVHGSFMAGGCAARGRVRCWKAARSAVREAARAEAAAKRPMSPYSGMFDIGEAERENHCSNGEHMVTWPAIAREIPIEGERSVCVSRVANRIDRAENAKAPPAHIGLAVVVQFSFLQRHRARPSVRRARRVRRARARRQVRSRCAAERHREAPAAYMREQQEVKCEREGGIFILETKRGGRDPGLRQTWNAAKGGISMHA